MYSALHSVVMQLRAECPLHLGRSAGERDAIPAPRHTVHVKLFAGQPVFRGFNVCIGNSEARGKTFRCKPTA
jgi:trehalose utilization protein